MKSALAITAIVGFVCVGSARAQSVQYEVNLNEDHLGPAAGWFTVTASASAFDNYGLASYKITMTGWDSLYQCSPKATLTDGLFSTQDIGFTTLRSANHSTPMTGEQPFVLNDPNLLTYGIGQGATALSVPAGWSLTGSPTNNPFQSQVVLLVGQYSSGTPKVDYHDDNTGAKVFDTADGVTVVDAHGPLSPPLWASTRGPYSILAGESLMLDGSMSHSDDGDIVTYDWDLDNDGVGDTGSGLDTVVLSYAQLESFGLRAGGTYDISLTVTCLSPAWIS